MLPDLDPYKFNNLGRSNFIKTYSLIRHTRYGSRTKRCRYIYLFCALKMASTHIVDFIQANKNAAFELFDFYLCIQSLMKVKQLNARLIHIISGYIS